MTSDRPPPSVDTVTLYTRDECHLCHEAEAALERVRAVHPFRLEVVDLDRQADAERRVRYDHEVPVVELAGRKVMKYRVDEARLLRLLRDARPGEGAQGGQDPDERERSSGQP